MSITAGKLSDPDTATIQVTETVPIAGELTGPGLVTDRITETLPRVNMLTDPVVVIIQITGAVSILCSVLPSKTL